MQGSKLFKTVLIIFLLIGIVLILVHAKPFLVPLAFAGLLSLFLFPVTRWLESKGVHPVLGTIAAVFTFLGALAIIISLLGWQLSDLAKDSHQIEQQLTQKISEARKYIAEQLGIPEQKQDEMMNQQKGSGGMSSMFTGMLTGAGAFLTNFLLMLVYMFLIIHFRRHFINFILRLVSPANRAEASAVMRSAQQAIEKYFTGLALMIMGLWVMYGIGFSIVGVKSPIFFAMLCGTLEIVPFVGNLAGTAITILMSLGQGASLNMLVWIAVTYGIVQFVQSYLLEPLVVGREVSINPFFTIAGIVAGEAVWGIPGMVMAIPTMAIFKIVCDHVPSLKPYGYLVGNGEDKKKTKTRRA